MENTLLEEVKEVIKRDKLRTYLSEDKERESTLFIALFSGSNCRKVNFHLHKDLYFIDFDGLAAFNFAEEQSISAEEVIGDMESVLSQLKAGQILLNEYSLLGRKAYAIHGLDPKRFAETEGIPNSLIKRFGKKTLSVTLRLE